MSLDGRVVLVTGGSSGIGKAAAHAFALAGARVIIAARGAERGEEAVSAIRREGGNARFVQADVSRAEEVDRLLRETIAACREHLLGKWSRRCPGWSPLLRRQGRVLALTKAAAQEYATHCIRVNALVAGAFRTPMLEADAASFVTGRSMIVDGGMTASIR